MSPLEQRKLYIHCESFETLFLCSSVMLFIPFHAARSLFIFDLISSIDWLVGDIDIAVGGDGYVAL